MTQVKKILDRVLRGMSDTAIDFQDQRRLLLTLDFQERIRGSHPIYTRSGMKKSEARYEIILYWSEEVTRA